MTAPAQPVQLQAAYAQQTQQLRNVTVAALVAAWLGLQSWRDPDIERFLQRAEPILAASLRRMSATTAWYLTRSLRDLTGRTRPVPTPQLEYPRGGVDPATVYARPFRDVWTAIADGKPLEQAVQDGQRRLENLAQTDLQLAKTHTAREVLAREDDIVGYRRVLEGAYSCGLCIVASTVRYHKADLMPIHPGCDCGIEPIHGDHDPGRTIDAQRLVDVHDAVHDRFGRDSPAAREIRGALNDKGEPVLYRDVLITHEHGELGPVLSVRGQKFTGPADVADATVTAAS